MSSDLEALRESLGQLEKAFELSKGECAKRMPKSDPLLVRDVNGRYLLIDALTEIVRARSVIVQATRNIT